MGYTNEDKRKKELRVDCKKCFGLCCVALYFSASEGFPTNKDAGKPCINLKKDFTCSVHKNLKDKGLKGCMAYDCFGAGQKLAQVTYKGEDWRKNSKYSKEMFDGFLIMRQLHEMLWYLSEAFTLQKSKSIKEDIKLLMDKTESLTMLEPNSLLEVDVEIHRNEVNKFLKNTSEMIRNKYSSRKKGNSKNSGGHRRVDYFGANLKKTNLRGADLRGACLIASNVIGGDLSGADLIGADLRDADFSGANLSKSIFLTQAQINAAKGDSNTKLPEMLVHPSHWEK